jgi:hypothetical protein
MTPADQDSETIHERVESERSHTSEPTWRESSHRSSLAQTTHFERNEGGRVGDRQLNFLDQPQGQPLFYTKMALVDVIRCRGI